jgi:hypothetical protein
MKHFLTNVKKDTTENMQLDENEGFSTNFGLENWGGNLYIGAIFKFKTLLALAL